MNLITKAVSRGGIEVDWRRQQDGGGGVEAAILGGLKIDRRRQQIKPHKMWKGVKKTLDK